ncbi:carboxyl-terminal processing protease CtpZ [Prochlorococcus sp. MIT 1300]|uniref:carboxyl-terminal processing protease CtpZ n=1 Tax=Prochlorococcus sp. MIT 1300 TaxID=3096218 RepID=UPI002A76141C|nr:carboxyl-terminal processing protease CtpZ [Prochlorococcus sp. MIT 1300]
MSLSVNSWSKALRRMLIALTSLCICIFLNAPTAIALNDGQQLVLDSWSLVNEGYLEPKKFDEIQWRKLRQKALEKPIETSDQAYAAIEAMLLPIGDPYTRLLRPTDYTAMKASNLGSEINGVGLQLGARPEDGEIVVIAPLEGSPAADAGIISGTVLLSVNGESPKKLGLEATASRLRGETGSQVLIKLQSPDGESEEIILERREVDLRPVRTRRLRNESHTLGYLRITQFSEGVPEQVNEALQELSEKEIEGLVLDLRNNSGGLVSSGLAVADVFLKNKPIVITKNRDGINDPIPSSSEILYEGPMVTLVNQGTASASEILAGALKDNGRSQLLGDRTFGKGLIQSLTTLSDGSGLAVTVSAYLTPNGTDIQGNGLKPDRILDKPEPLNPGSSEDRWLQDAELFMGANLDIDRNKELEMLEASEAATLEIDPRPSQSSFQQSVINPQANR